VKRREFIKLQPIGFKLMAEGAFAACKDIGSDSKSLSLSNNERLSSKISVPQQKWAAPGVAAVIQCDWLHGVRRCRGGLSLKSMRP
jgi:hypothetical protein